MSRIFNDPKDLKYDKHKRIRDKIRSPYFPCFIQFPITKGTIRNLLEKGKSEGISNSIQNKTVRPKV